MTNVTGGFLDLQKGTLHVMATVGGGHLSIRLVGELDLDCANLLSEVDQVIAGQVNSVVVDLTELEFIDSTGVSAMLRLHQRHEAAGRTVRFQRPQPGVRRVFSVLGLDGYLAP